MLVHIFTNEMTYWLLGTALVFTFVGRWMAVKDDVQDIVAATIDSLIDQGYLRTKGQGDNIEILKHWEKDDKTTR